MKELILKEIFVGVQKLEFFNILHVPNQVVSKVARTTAPEKIGIQIRWLGRVIGICAQKDRSMLAQKER